VESDTAPARRSATLTSLSLVLQAVVVVTGQPSWQRGLPHGHTSAPGRVWTVECLLLRPHPNSKESLCPHLRVAPE
jgi:hypothetical protein